MRYGTTTEEWGQPCEVPDGAKAIWGARAIFKPRDKRPLDLLGDRQSVHGAAADELVALLNGGILDALQEWARWRDGTSSEEFVMYEDDQVRVVGSARGSYGYYYVTGWLKG